MSKTSEFCVKIQIFIIGFKHFVIVFDVHLLQLDLIIVGAVVGVI